MKLNESYLCCEITCNEVFQIKRKGVSAIQLTKLNNDTTFNTFSTCPVCGNKNIRNIGRLLNRRGENED
jgi:hypothetical protein